MQLVFDDYGDKYQFNFNHSFTAAVINNKVLT